MSLLNEVESVRLRLVRADNARENINEVEELERLRKVIESYSQKLSQLANNAEMLEKEGVALTSASSLEKVVQLVEGIKEKFSENQSSQTLKQGRRWSGFKDQLEALSRDIYLSQKINWKDYFDNTFFCGVPPAQKERILLRTPENDKSMIIYKELFDRFSKYKSVPPRDSEEFIELRNLSHQLNSIKFKEDAPECVRKFLAATNAGANLELLTSEVLDWLRSNNLLDSYVVRVRYN